MKELSRRFRDEIGRTGRGRDRQGGVGRKEGLGRDRRDGD